MMLWITFAIALVALVGLIWHAMIPTPPAHTRALTVNAVAAASADYA